MSFVLVLPTVWNLDNGKQARAGHNFTCNIYQCPIFLSFSSSSWSLILDCTYKAYCTSNCRCLIPPHQHHHSQQEGKKYTFLSGLLNTETAGCYKTAQQSLLCVVVDLRLGLSHNGALCLPVVHTRANPERSLSCSH